MSISRIAAQLYTVQARRKVPLRTAFSMIVREDLAMRFSVYNLVKTLTRSDFLATVAQTAYGKRTPMQKMQDREERQQADSQQKFKRFTAASIANLNKRLDILTGITERNTALISNLYSELGAGRTYRRINPNTVNPSALRIPIPSRTIRSQIDSINTQLQELRERDLRRGGARPRARGRGQQQRQQQQQKTNPSLFNAFFAYVIRNPAMLAMLASGVGRAMGLGTLALGAYSMYNAPGAIGRAITRLGGQNVYGNPITEQTSQFVDPGIAGAGAFAATELTMGAARMIRNRRLRTAAPVSAVEARQHMQGTMQRRFMQRGMDNRQAFGKASRRTAQLVRASEQVKRFQKISGAFKFAANRIPGVQMATVAFELSRMGGYTADRASGLMSQEKYKDSMVNSYNNLIENVGYTTVGGILGGLAGTALFPGVGTTVFAAGGALTGLLVSLLGDEDDKYLATKLFELLHEDRVMREKPSTASYGGGTPSGGATPSDEEHNKRGNAPRGGGPIDREQVYSKIKDDKLFLEKVKQVADKYQIKVDDLLAVMYSESKLDPSAQNNKHPFKPTKAYIDGKMVDVPGGKATGLLQFIPATAATLGTTTEALRVMSRVEQMEYVDKYLDYWMKMGKLKKGANAGDIYAVMFQPARAHGEILAREGEAAYDKNRVLDFDGNKIITKSDLAEFARMKGAAAEKKARQIVQAAEAANNQRNVAKVPEAPPPVAANTPEMEETQVNAVAALDAVATVNQRVNLLAKETDRRIQTFEKLNPQENPVARNTGFKHSINRA